jgi:hypothetical protein
MARFKNVRGGPDDDERHPPRLIDQEKAKGPKKTLAKKKHKHDDIEAERVAAVAAAAAECAERDGRAMVFALVRPSFTLRVVS